MGPTYSQDIITGTTRGPDHNRTVLSGTAATRYKRNDLYRKLGKTRSETEQSIVDKLTTTMGGTMKLLDRGKIGNKYVPDYSDQELLDNAFVVELAESMAASAPNARQKAMLKAYQKHTDRQKYDAELLNSNNIARNEASGRAAVQNSANQKAYNDATQQAVKDDEAANKAHELQNLNIARNVDSQQVRTAHQVGNTVQQVSQLLAQATGTKVKLPTPTVDPSKVVGRSVGLWNEDWDAQKTVVAAPTTATAESAGFVEDTGDIPYDINYFATHPDAV